MTADSDPLLSVLRARRSPIRRVRYRDNRTVLLSISRDGRTLNSHRCFRDAPPEILAAIATFLTARRTSAGARRALEQLRSWEGTQRGLAAARRQRPRRRRPVTDGPGTAALRTLFQQLNHEAFDGRLPTIPLRVSRRMTRSLGTIRYGPEGDRDAPHASHGSHGSHPPRTVLEIAIASDLLLPLNREFLRDTLLHEMAHAEAWLQHGHRGHGRPWRRIAERVGCTPRATCRSPITRRPRSR